MSRVMITNCSTMIRASQNNIVALTLQDTITGEKFDAAKQRDLVKITTHVEKVEVELVTDSTFMRGNVNDNIADVSEKMEQVRV